MQRVEIRRVLSAKPFEPFTIHTTDGELIGVKSPEFAWLSPTADVIVVAMEELGDGGSTRVISLPHISQLTIGPHGKADAA